MRMLISAISLCLLGSSAIWAQQKTAADAAPQQNAAPPARTTYMGRKIAQTMHYTGAQWLIRNEREREERCSLTLKNLGVRSGMTICDMGCGNGYYSLRLAKLATATGRILAVDVQPQMLFLLRQRFEQAGVENITPILGSMYDPRLPANSCDMILMVDVYHELSYPERMLAAMRRALKPKGEVVLVEYRAEDPDVPIKPLHKMSKQQVLKEMTANGFKLSRQFDGLPWQHLMAFQREEGEGKR